MKRTWLILVVALAVGRCGCGETIVGDPDATDTTGEFVDSTGEDAGGEVECEECDDSDPCTEDSCDPVSGDCVNDPLDGDGDGYSAMLATDGVTVCPGNDCDDADDTIYPGASEVCMDGVDQDCDTLVDGPMAMRETAYLKTLAWMATHPDMVWTGSEYVVVWDELEASIHMARVGPDGEMVGGVIDLVDSISEGDFASAPRLAWTGSELGVAFDIGDLFEGDGAAFRDVILMRVSPSGAVIAESDRLNSVDTLAWAPGLVWTGSEFGVAWLDGRDDDCSNWALCNLEVYFARMDPGGVVVGIESRLTDVTGTVQMSADMPVWTGSNYVVGWRVHSRPDMFFTFLDGDGVVVSPNVPMTRNGTGNVWTGSEIATVWTLKDEDEWQTALVRYSPNGVEVGAPSQIAGATTTYNGSGDLAWTGSEHAIVWLDGRNSGCTGQPISPGTCDYDLYFTMLDPVGSRLWDDVRINTRNAWNAMPSMVWSGSSFGLAWFEYGEGGGFDYNLMFDVISFCD